MQRICAWCGRDLGTDEPSDALKAEAPSTQTSISHLGRPRLSDDPGVTSTICSGCAAALSAYRKPVLVVSQKWARMYEELVELLKDRPDIQVVLDRRHSTKTGGEVAGWDGPERRKNRHSLALE